ncbi:hypothetical protein HMF7854_03120 [Sphingomonas ginkgonis]|uniref:Mannan endo-1,4-beta-mannosidase n=1 Tax=Sphingomonas ginkgonis TaxID=2315330 RepID=A0A429V7H1_9SPHN|nr:hypothetical protein [Sphingomonas ginkgonis]RST29926.1 hypothetical protein HMF7854_03120 [Sphingomonas ginkgonis]
MLLDPGVIVPSPATAPFAADRAPGWIGVAPGAPYFVDEAGAPWTPIGQNDAISWPELAPLYRRRDPEAVERHLRGLKAQGVTCLRLMLEYAQGRHRYLERPTGRFVPAMVQLWDDLFALCERTGLRILLTPVDTYWTWVRFRHHPWNVGNGGPLANMRDALLRGVTRAAIKARLEFAVRRWGGSGALFAWDLWNEIHPAQSRDSTDGWDDFIHDLSGHVRGLEQRLYGRSHPQTVSLFGPELILKPHLAPAMREAVFRHPDVDFASLHIYAKGSIDNPRDTVAPALAMAAIVAESIGEIRDGRPFLDTEHGPIHAFKDRHRTLPEPFDDEMFRHCSWAHLAAGGAGGGMRWPNRHPHVLTAGMRRAQQAMVGFLPEIDWPRFRRRPFGAGLRARHVHAVGCGDERQALIWLVRRDGLGSDGRLREGLVPVRTSVAVPGLADGRYRVRGWDTLRGEAAETMAAEAAGGMLHFTTAELTSDRAFAIAPAA